MESISNIITLRAARTSIVPSKMEEPKEEPGREEFESLVSSVQKVLDNMEEIWEIDHGAVELRDKFHLLRCYLDYMNRYYEGCRLP
jgi:hypothetical protein